MGSARSWTLLRGASVTLNTLNTLNTLINYINYIKYTGWLSINARYKNTSMDPSPSRRSRFLPNFVPSSQSSQRMEEHFCGGWTSCRITSLWVCGGVCTEGGGVCTEGGGVCTEGVCTEGGGVCTEGGDVRCRKSWGWGVPEEVLGGVSGLQQPQQVSSTHLEEHAAVEQLAVSS